jgi:hypothetical protein
LIKIAETTGPTMVDMVVDAARVAPKLETGLYSLHSQGAEAVSLFLQVFFCFEFFACL